MRLVFSVVCAVFHLATATNCTSRSKSQVAGKHVTCTILWSNQLTLDEQTINGVAMETTAMLLLP